MYNIYIYLFFDSWFSTSTSLCIKEVDCPSIKRLDTPIVSSILLLLLSISIIKHLKKTNA